jgi:hypothetical protein
MIGTGAAALVPGQKLYKLHRINKLVYQANQVMLSYVFI